MKMGNCQDVLFHNEVRPHKIPDRRRKGMASALQPTSSTTTMPTCSTWSLAPEDKSVQPTWRGDTSSKSTMATSKTTQPVRPVTMTPRPRPRLSKDSSLRLMTAQEEELGGIRYEFSGLEDATMEAKLSQKPILCIEVHFPGNEHMPVNVAGQISYTTLRILDGSGINVVKPIQDTSLSMTSVASAMIQALNTFNLRVPTYLALLEEEHFGKRWKDPSNFVQKTDQQAIFGTNCPKRGEVEFAAMCGVLSTRAGYYQGNHVVQVTYDSTRLSYCRLLRCALQRDVANVIYYQSNEERVVGIVERQRRNVEMDMIAFQPQGILHKSVDPKPALRATMLRFVPLTDLQSTRANWLVSMGSFNEAMRLLSPRQGQIMMRACQNPRTRKDVVDVDVTIAWRSLSEPKPVQTCQ